MKNSIGEEIIPQRNEITFTQLSGKHLKCNSCGVKVTRDGVESHRNSHRPIKKNVQVQVNRTQEKVSQVTN